MKNMMIIYIRIVNVLKMKKLLKKIVIYIIQALIIKPILQHTIRNTIISKIIYKGKDLFHRMIYNNLRI